MRERHRLQARGSQDISQLLRGPHRYFPRYRDGESEAQRGRDVPTSPISGQVSDFKRTLLPQHLAASVCTVLTIYKVHSHRCHTTLRKPSVECRVGYHHPPSTDGNTELRRHPHRHKASVKSWTETWKCCFFSYTNNSAFY